MPMFLIFKTNVESPEHANIIQFALISKLATATCSFDLEDCDHILRVASNHPVEDIIQIVRESGFECEELPD